VNGSRAMITSDLADDIDDDEDDDEVCSMIALAT